MTEAFLLENIDSLEGTARYASLFFKKKLFAKGAWEVDQQ
jgi:hypothetical protein